MTEVYTSEARRAAVDYRERGWSPIPIKPRSKEPKLPKEHPFLRRRATAAEFGGFDFGHNVGIVAGRVSGIIVLDDDDDGETLRKNSWNIPATPTVKTRRGHQHYFRCPDSGLPTFVVAGKLEVRGDGAYVVAPPSIHPSGEVYEWVISPDDAELADLPDWLIEQARSRGRRMRAENVGETIPNGSRNKTLFSIAGSLRRRGLDEATIAAALFAINSTKCKPPLDEDEVRKLARSAARYEADDPIAGAEPEANRHRHRHHERRTLTDLGLAERFVDGHGKGVRWCGPWGKWLIYDGVRWVLDDTGEVERLMKATARDIYAEAAEAKDDAKRKAIADFARRSESAKRISDALRLARSEPSIPILPRQLDADPWALNVENGTVDLRTGELREHRREDLITKLAPVEYDPQAQAQTFDAFMERILSSEALRRFVMRALGYAAAGVVSEEVLVILYGVGANGKSTLVNAVMETLGDYATQAAPDLLLAKRGSHPTELADLFGARLVASVEVEDGRRMAEGLVKQLTGRDRIKARRMREDFWEFDPTHTVFLATNHRPEVRGTDHAIWRRLKLVPFEVTIPEKEQDKGLAEKLRAEMPGILVRIVRGCLEWRRDGLGEPEEVKAATTTYRVEMDVLAAFIEDRCVVHGNAKVASARLYNAYRDWCQQGGEAEISQTKFSLRLKERGFRKEKDGLVFWHGIGLRDDRPDPDPPSPGEGESSGDEAPSPPSLEGSAPSPPSGESEIGKGNTLETAGESGESGPHTDITSFYSSHEALMLKNPPNPPNPPGPSEEGGSGTPRGGSVKPRLKPGAGHRQPLTPDEAERVQRLIAEGASPRWARAEVLGE